MIGLNGTLGWQPEIWRAVCVARARGRRSWVQCQWVSSGKFMSGKFASDQLFTAVPENLIPRHFFFSLRSISVEARAVIGDCLGPVRTPGERQRGRVITGDSNESEQHQAKTWQIHVL